MRIPQWGMFLICVLGSQAAGLVGSLFTASAIPTWYATLIKPEIAPPNWIFAPVWTTLFLFMGIAAFLVWRAGFWRKDVRVGMILFAIQLTVNVSWSLFFFGLKSPGFALLSIAALWLLIAATMFFFARVSRAAALLLLPYLAWVSFASYLNYLIWTLN